jgi:hypothetical protein
MKKILSILLMLLVVTMLSAGDVYDKAVSINSWDGGAVITFVSTAGTDSTGSQHSLPIYIGDCNDADAYITSKVATASDVNVFYHVSNDLTNWITVTLGDLDATSSTAKRDTLGGEDSNADYFHIFPYLIIEHDFQAAATSDDIITTKIWLKTDQAGKEPDIFKLSGSISDPQ